MTLTGRIWGDHRGIIGLIAQRAISDERSARERQEKVGIASHMANVAFDKHVAFCEAYGKELRETLATITNADKLRDTLKHWESLRRIRAEHSMWLTADLHRRLEEFEIDVKKIGAESLSRLSEEDRRKVFGDGLQRILVMIGEEHLPMPAGMAFDRDRSISGVIRGLGKFLGVEDLAGLRQRIVENAAVAEGLGKKG